MECRSPRPMPCWRMEKEGFGLEDRRPLSTGVPASRRCIPFEGLKSNAGDIGINSLARGADGSLWVGIAAAGPGLGLGRLEEGVFRSFVTPNFDGSKVSVYDMMSIAMAVFGSLAWAKGIFRIRGDVVEHYGRTEGLSSDTVCALSLKTERESYGLRLRMESTAFAIRALSLFPQSKDWGRCSNRRSGQQGWHDLDCELWIARSHR